MKLSRVNSYHISLDREKSELLGDVLNVNVPPLGRELSILKLLQRKLYDRVFTKIIKKLHKTFFVK